MSWRESLIRISNYEVETLQKRLHEIVERRTHAEIRLTLLAAEAEAEIAYHAQNADAAWPLTSFLAGVKARREAVHATLELIAAEEAGARDALAQAFEALKKFEHIAESARLASVKEAARRETAAMDEMGLRARAR